MAARKESRAGARQPPRTPGSAATSLSKADALLDVAAAEFNQQGIAGASLTRIAGAVGVSRAALYYYVDSREDLAYRCYLRACQIAAQDLAAASRAGNGMARVRDFISRTLAPERPPAVVLSETHVLGDTRRAQINAAHGANVAALRGFVEAGIADRSIRACDAEVAAQVMVGILSWVPLTEEWSAGIGEAARRQGAGALIDLLSEGIAADPSVVPACPLDASEFALRPRNAFERGAVAAAKVDLLVRTASRLFNQRGIDGTSLDQITQELGATKGAFYQYIRDKTALVTQCHERSMDLAEAFADAATRAGRTGLERALFGLHLLVQAYAGELSPLAPLTGLGALPAKARTRIRARGLALQQRYESFDRTGLADGSVRTFDLHTMSAISAGVFSWIPKWRTDADPRTPRALADEIVALFNSGLRRR